LPFATGPVVSAVAATAVLLALAAPAVTLNTTTTGMDDISIPEIVPIQNPQKAFPGGDEPAVVAIQADDVTSAPARQAVAELKQKALASGQMNNPIEVEVSRDKTVATIDIPLAGDGTNDVSLAALSTLRDEIVPQTVGKVDGVEYAVGGMTAASRTRKQSRTGSRPPRVSSPAPRSSWSAPSRCSRCCRSST
jgi:putative drug exporter of the RND superfamily